MVQRTGTVSVFERAYQHMGVFRSTPHAARARAVPRCKVVDYAQLVRSSQGLQALIQERREWREPVSESSGEVVPYRPPAQDVSSLFLSEYGTGLGRYLPWRRGLALQRFDTRLTDLSHEERLAVLSSSQNSLIQAGLYDETNAALHALATKHLPDSARQTFLYQSCRELLVRAREDAESYVRLVEYYEPSLAMKRMLYVDKYMSTGVDYSKVMSLPRQILPRFRSLSFELQKVLARELVTLIYCLPLTEKIQDGKIVPGFVPRHPVHALIKLLKAMHAQVAPRDQEEFRKALEKATNAWFGMAYRNKHGSRERLDRANEELRELLRDLKPKRRPFRG